MYKYVGDDINRSIEKDSRSMWKLFLLEENERLQECGARKQFTFMSLSLGNCEMGYKYFISSLVTQKQCGH